MMATGVGAVIGQGIVKSLKAAKGIRVRVVGVDCNPHSVGLHWTDAKRVVPRADDPGWVDAFASVCKEEKVDLVLPGIEQDVRALQRHRAAIEQRTAARLLLNSERALQVGLDKWELNVFAVQHDILVPRTRLAREAESVDAGFPILLKPRRGMAGKGMFLARSAVELKERLARIPVDEYLLQQHVGTDDEEYTVGIFGGADGAVTQPILLRRRLNYGSTFEAETVDDPCLAALAITAATRLAIRGPTNLQYRKAEGRFHLIEVNPRFSSSTSIKAAFGFNEAEMAVRSFVQGRPLEPVELRTGRCSRYIEDWVVYS